LQYVIQKVQQVIFVVVVVVSSLPIPLPQTSVNYIPKASVLELVAAIIFIGIFNASNNRL